MNPSIFQPGDVCAGSYSIERLETSSRVAETYLARRTATRQQVILTCSRFEHAPSGSPLRDSFRSNASKLTAAVIEDSPRFLAADVTQGVYWVVREHFDDAVPIWDLLTTSIPTSTDHAAFMNNIRVSPLHYYWAIVVGLGLHVADILEQSAKLGIYHGGIDPARNLVIRSFNRPCVLEAGYGHLFGFDYFENGNTARLSQAPELRKGHSVSACTDIYAFGLALRVILEHGAKIYKFKTPPEFAARLERLYAKDPSKRCSSWEDVCSIFNDEFDVAHAKVEAIEKARRDSKDAPKTAPEMPTQAPTIAELPPPDQIARAAEDPGSGERPCADLQGTDTDPAPPPLMPEASTIAPASPSHHPALSALKGKMRDDAGLSDIVDLVLFLSEKVDQRRRANAIKSRSTEGGAAEGGAADSSEAQSSADEAPTPRLPTLPHLRAGEVPPRGDVVANGPKSPPSPSPGQVCAPSAASIVMPTATAIPTPSAPLIEPSTPARAGQATSQRPIPRSSRWAVSASVAMLVGLVGLRAVLLLEARGLGAHSSAESTRRWLAVPEDSRDGEAARAQQVISTPSLTRADPELRKGQRPVARNAHAVVDWLASVRATKPPQTKEEE